MPGGNNSPLARVIVVVGARGGAGASSLAVAIAQSSAHTGKQVVLLDADELGGGIDLVLGIEGHRGVQWSELAAVDGSSFLLCAICFAMAGIPDVINSWRSR
ncbi:MAG: P-loop NTPase [Actinobacteria bacterium]|nr:P-loop NTPase [Actinomycetota bacterium]